MLSIQNKTNNNPFVQENIVSSQRRINSIAIIHRILYNSDNIARIDFEIYLNKLASNLIHSLKKEHQDIALDIISANIHMNLETAIPLGLIINEIITNALKYAFLDNLKDRISIQIEHHQGQQYTLYIGDNGRSIPAEFDPKKSKSLGTKLIQSLSYQLSGSTKLDDTRPRTNYIITIKKID